MINEHFRSKRERRVRELSDGYFSESRRETPRVRVWHTTSAAYRQLLDLGRLIRQCTAARARSPTPCKVKVQLFMVPSRLFLFLAILVHEGGSASGSLPPCLPVPRSNDLAMDSAAHAVVLLNIELGQLVVGNNACIGEIAERALVHDVPNGEALDGLVLCGAAPTPVTVDQACVVAPVAVAPMVPPLDRHLRLFRSPGDSTRRPFPRRRRPWAPARVSCPFQGELSFPAPRRPVDSIPVSTIAGTRSFSAMLRTALCSFLGGVGVAAGVGCGLLRSRNYPHAPF